jgi:tripartite-type tricarboxylate transporter receptor subunit TctC
MFNFMRTRAASRPLAYALSSFVATLSTTVLAQPAETISKQIIIYVAGTAGGGIDLYARFLARYLGKHIPGNPTVVVQDMPGAGGIRTANFIAQAAPRDGTAIGTFPGGPLIEPLVGARTVDYDMSKFNWIGAISRDVSVCFALGTTPFKTIDDAKAREMVIAGTGAGSETDTLPLVLNETLGTKFKVITGYLGSKETLLAMENGEVHGRCGMTYSSLRAAKPDWLRDKMVNILVQLGRQKSSDLPNVPLISDLLSKSEDKQLFDLLTVGTVVGRPFALPPGTPSGLVTMLRRAFDATMVDPDFLAEGQKTNSEINPTTGDDVQRIIAGAYATPKPVVDRAKTLLAPAAK